MVLIHAEVQKAAAAAAAAAAAFHLNFLHYPPLLFSLLFLP
jgi:hypothetical protein